MSKLYYTAPEDRIFNEVKNAASAIWKTYDNRFGYVDSKLEILNRLQNVRDNLMYIISMFDSSNQLKLSQMISEDARFAIRERLIDGGLSDEYIFF